MTNAKIVLSQITHFNWAKLFHASMGKVDAWQKACAIFLLCAATAIASSAQTFSTLVNFNGSGTNGASPAFSSLVEGTDGNLYGTTYNGGSTSCTLGCGTVFKLTPGGTLTTLYSFCSLPNCSDGKEPYVGMVLGTDGNFYGTTLFGGNTENDGTVFKITPAGALTTLYTFCSQTHCDDGKQPAGTLVLGTDGNFYGTTTSGGVHNDGTVFNISPTTGILTTLHTFDESDGINPRGALVLDTDGNFYGTTAGGGTAAGCTVTGGCGTVFEITPEGVLQTLYNFCSQTNCADGATPYGNLIQATDGNFYGTTTGGGVSRPGGTGGTIFKITPQGALTTLYTFCAGSAGCPDGANPYAGLIQATDGNFYGTTYGFGAHGAGTLFSFTMEDVLTTLYSFAGTGTSIQAYGQLVQATNGIFYGTTNLGGTNNKGTVYSLSMAFVILDPDFGEVLQTVDILGQVTGTTAVSFNGTLASFTQDSGTELTATVPNGATTGIVTVTTSSGTVTSNQPFHVTPQITSFSPTSAPVGTKVTITGVSLTQTTQVLFGGVNAPLFVVTPDTQVMAKVPTGAITGPITITTAGGTVVSSTIFHVDF